MYGYVVPQKDNLKMQDFALYRAFYCGICKVTGSLYGQIPRLTTNYDIVFLSLLLHDCHAQDVSFCTGGCVLNPFQKKTTVERNDLMDKIVAVNIILSYYKAGDDVIDERGIKKKLVKSMLEKPYRKARELLPEVDGIIHDGYESLRVLEQQNAKGIDRVAHCFANLLMLTAKELLGANADENSLKLCYNIGKFVYLIDAVDDIGEDSKKKRYNPFLAEFGNYKNRKQFIEDNRKELEFIFAITTNRAIECFNGMKFTQSYDLLANIVHKGLRMKTEEVLSSAKKLPKPKV